METRPNFWSRLFWKFSLIVLLLILVSQLTIIWLMGAQETDDAFASGRRFLISLDGKEINGRLISSAKTEELTEKTEELKDGTKEEAKEEEPEGQQEESQQSSVSESPESASSEAEKPEVISNIETLSEEQDFQLPPITPSSNITAEFSANQSEKTEFGFLPKISSNGVKPWKYYAKKFSAMGSKPLISIIVSGLGQSKNVTELALRLPENINLSFSPYTKNLGSWAISARLSGHEILLDLPMEAADYPVSDPGPLGLLVSKEQGENENRIKKLMARDFGYVGFITPRNEVFLENNDLLKSLLQVISGRGLMLVMGRKPARDETAEIIEDSHTANIIIDTNLDEELTETAIKARFTELEQIAKQRGYAVGMMRGYPITIKQLNEWAAKADANGFSIAPISAIVSKRY